MDLSRPVGPFLWGVIPALPSQWQFSVCYLIFYLGGPSRAPAAPTPPSVLAGARGNETSQSRSSALESEAARRGSTHPLAIVFSSFC
jgi:hypothetical protein